MTLTAAQLFFPIFAIPPEPSVGRSAGWKFDPSARRVWLGSMCAAALQLSIRTQRPIIMCAALSPRHRSARAPKMPTPEVWKAKPDNPKNAYARAHKSTTLVMHFSCERYTHRRFRKHILCEQLCRRDTYLFPEKYRL